MALLAGPNIAKELKVGHLTVYNDSQLLVKQVRDKYEAREKNMKKYLTKTKELIEPFPEFHCL